jgi:hypothetical protein
MGMNFYQFAFPQGLKPRVLSLSYGTAKQATEKLDPEGGGGFQPPHKVNKFNAGFSPGGVFFRLFAQHSPFFRSL